MEMGLVDNSYPQLLIDTHGLQDMKWVNTSEPGLTTDRFVETLYKRIAVMQPKIVVVTIGGNDFLNQLNAKDVDLDSAESRQKLIDWFNNSRETLDNIDTAVKTLTAQNIRVVFGMIRPGGMFTGMFEAEGYPEVSEAMHNWYERILDTLKAVDSDKLYIVEDIMEGIWDDHISEDGIHPTQEGYHLMAKNFNLCFQKAVNDL